MLGYIRQEGSVSQQRFTWLIEAFVDEALEEMKDGTPEQTGAFFDELARLLHWVATGEIDGEFQELLPQNLGPRLAITAKIVQETHQEDATIR